VGGKLRFGRQRVRLRKGERARIVSGPFSGFVGELEGDEVRETVSLLINLFSRLVQVTVGVDEIEAACQLPDQTENESLF
jgi:transcription antitermination factor NusG